MQQLAKRIHNGHAYLRQDPKALALKPGSMDLNVGQHAQAGLPGALRPDVLQAHGAASAAAEDHRGLAAGAQQGGCC